MRSTCRSLACFGALLFLASVGKGVVFQFPAGPPGSTMPHYYSGTSSRASASAIGANFTDAYLYLVGSGEETLVSEFHSDGEFYPMSVSLSCIFDSSHFPDISTVQTKLRGYIEGSAVPIEDTSPAVIVRNLASFFEHPDPKFNPDGAPTARDSLLGQNYALAILNSTPWTEALYFNLMQGSNVMCYIGHGSPTAHTPGEGGGTFWNEYLSERQQSIGQGYPPYNSGPSIPINLLYLLACNCGDDNNFVAAA